MPGRSLLVRLGIAAGLIALYLAAAAQLRTNPSAAALLVGGALLLAFSLFVLWTGPRVPLNRAFFLYGLSATAYLALVFLLHLAREVGIEPVRGAVWVLRNGLLMIPPAMMLFTYRFVGGRGGRLRALVWAALISMLPFVALNLAGRYVTDYEPLEGGWTYVPAGDLLWYRLGGSLTVGWAMVSGGIVAAQCFRPEQRPRRRQFVLFLAAWVPGVSYALLGYLPAFHRSWFPVHIGAGWAVVSMGLGFAVIRFNLFDIKVIIRRTLPYAAGTALLGGLYAGCLAGLHAVGARLDVLPRGSQWAIFLILIGLAFQPVLEMIQAGLDRLFFRTEAALDRSLAEAGARYREAASRRELALVLARHTRETLKLTSAAVLLGRETVEDCQGEPPPEALASAAGLRMPVIGGEKTAIAPDEQGRLALGPEALELSKVLSRSGVKLVVPLGDAATRGLLACGEKSSHLELNPRDRTFLMALATQADAALSRLDARSDAAAAHRLTEAVFESMTNAVALLADDGLVQACNPAFETAQGVAAGERLAPPALEALLGGGATGGTREVECPRGTFLVSSRRLQGRNLSTLAVLTDVTELRRLQEADRRRAALSELGATISAINHEISNILSPLGYNLDKAARARTIEEAACPLQVAGERVRTLERLGRELREFYRDPQLVVRRVRLAEVVASTLADLRAMAGTAWVAPATGGLECEVAADPQKLKQVLLNIGKNAWEAMAECAERRWSFTATCRDRAARIIVQDSGPGIPPEHVARLFKPFFSTKKDKGTGLGLAIVRRIAEAHGADVRVESSPGTGSAVILTWPLAD